MNGCVKVALEIAKYTTDKITRMLERVLNETPSTMTTIGLYPYTASERQVSSSDVCTTIRAKRPVHHYRLQRTM